MRWLVVLVFSLCASIAAAQAETVCMQASYASQTSALRTATVDYYTFLNGFGGHSENDKVNDAINWCALGPTTGQRIWEGMKEADDYTGVLDLTQIAEYPANVLYVEPDCSFPPSAMLSLKMTQAETYASFGKKIAHAIWLDLRNIVPWNLADETATNLEYILRADNAWGFNGTVWNGWGVTYPLQQLTTPLDASPYDAYQVASSVVGTWTTQFDAFAKILQWSADNFDHVRVCDSLVVADVADMLILQTWRANPSKYVSRTGCHSSANYIGALLRNLNIPAFSTRGHFGGLGHEELQVPSLDYVLQHGDDIYDGIFGTTPTLSRLDSYARWAADVLPLGASTGWSDYHADLDRATVTWQIAHSMAYPSPTYQSYFCADPNYMETNFGHLFGPGNHFLLDEYNKRLEDITGCPGP